MQLNTSNELRKSAHPEKGMSLPDAGPKAPGDAPAALIAIAKSFFRYGKPYNPPCPPLKKGGELQGIAVKVPL